jgi:hypothetical protein
MYILYTVLLVATLSIYAPLESEMLNSLFTVSMAVLRIRDPVPFGPLDLGFGTWVKKQDLDPGGTTRILFPRA